MIPIVQQNTELKAALQSGAQTSHLLQKRLSLSQSGLSRAIQRNKNEIVILGAARSTAYALKQTIIQGLPTEIPVYQVKPNGDVSQYALLYTLAAGEYGFREEHNNTIQHQTTLPYLLQNMWPEGFMGRNLAHRCARDLGVPKDLKRWTDAHALLILTRRGEDLTGNLIVGKESLDRYFAQTREQPRIIAEEEKMLVFPELARKALAGEPSGSSAGGEQPKFTTITEGENGPQHVIVKFVQKKTETGQRWSDLLVCEAVAADILEKSQMSAALTAIYQDDEWTFLASTRFDRQGLWGRLPLVSMKTLAAEFIGASDNWSDCADQLRAGYLITAEETHHIQALEGFGALIGNRDMHLGNFSFFPEKERFVPAPIYDMGPMGYRPTDSGILPSEGISKAEMPAIASANTMRKIAAAFWRQAAKDSRISPSFRTLCRENYSFIKDLPQHPAMLPPI